MVHDIGEFDVVHYTCIVYIGSL